MRYTSKHEKQEFFLDSATEYAKEILIPQRRLSDWLPIDGEFEYGLQYMRPTVDEDFQHGPRFKTVSELQEHLELIRKTQDQPGAEQIVYKLYDRETGLLATWIGDKYDDVF